MKKNRVSATVITPQQGGRRVTELKMSQVRFDPNQPRKTFDATALNELAESIKSQELQQLPTVNFAFVEDGEPVYYIKAGERRYRAHELLRRETIWVIVEPEIYTGQYDPTRVLAQAAENSSREPHTHAEIISVMQMVIAEEKLKRGEKFYGLYEIALGRVATAFGKGRAWALNYRVLVDLHPELVELLDKTDESERLNFAIACSLARVPYANQFKLLEQAKPLKEKGGAKLMLRFITRQAEALRLSAGRSGRPRVHSDDKVVFLNTARGFRRLALHFVAERKSTEHRQYVERILGQMSAIEVDRLLADINEAMVTFRELAEQAKSRRDSLYQKFK